MGVPALMFSPPLDAAEMKRFLGVFYALLLGVGALVGRSWGGWGVVAVAAPFVLFFTGLALTQLGNEALSGGEKLAVSANFGAIYAVAWLAWRLGKRWPSPARERGRLL